VLREIALEADQPGPAGRALFVLAQSGKPKARETVVQVAKTAPAPIRVVAVRELGRLGGAEISKELLQVYSISDIPVKLQVVKSLGERLDQPALFTIVQQETDAQLRNRAIVTLGTAGGHEQLRSLYEKAKIEMKRSLVRGLCAAHAETDLIEIATSERDVALRNEIHTCLRILGTPNARDYLQKVGRNR
jgi:HEAT repeat protein